MQKYILIFLFLCIQQLCCSQIVFHDATQFPLLGKATQASNTIYERLPDSLKTVLRPALWTLSQNSAGLAIRFRSNSPEIAAKWEVLFDNHMNHMTDVGIKGLDLYSWEDNHWRFVNSARPTGKSTQTTIIANMEPKEREYLLYLPLYDGIKSLAIGVDSLFALEQPLLQYPVHEKPIVFYGTSILQGGCASRPGMAHTNIISRRLNRECINLGFSGNGLLDLEIARVIADVDAGVFVIDCIPNASVEQMEERMIKFYKIIRHKHPDTPIVFVEDPIFPHTYYDKRIAKEVLRKNAKLNEIYADLMKNKEKNIYLISSKDMLGNDAEATVDGIHFTDLGMMRYADLVTPILKKLLK